MGTGYVQYGNATIGTGKLQLRRVTTRLTLATAAGSRQSFDETAVYVGDASDLRALRGRDRSRSRRPRRRSCWPSRLPRRCSGQNETSPRRSPLPVRGQEHD